MKSIKEYIHILQNRGLCGSIRETKRAINPIWLTRDRDIVDIILRWRTYHRLKKKYYNEITQSVPYLNNYATPPRIIWICWLQGEENAPKIVKKCIDSVRKWAKDYEIRVLTQENIFSYCEIPDYILDKLNRGNINFTFFSDILRCCLLSEYGGIWIDATVFLSDELPEWIVNEPFFIYRNSWLDHKPTKTSTWLIAACVNHPIIQIAKDCLFAYCKQKYVQEDYYIFHLFLALIVQYNENCQKLFNRMLYMQNADAHTLQFKLFDEFNEHQWQHILDRSSIHKLTYKFHDKQLLTKEGTFYDYILNHQ